MSKALIILLCLLFCSTVEQTLNPILLLPTQTTQNVVVDYAFRFQTDTNIPNSASIAITFPFEYDPRELIRYTGCFYSSGNNTLSLHPCSIVNRTFTIIVGQIQTGVMTVLIKNIRNPVEASMSSHFNIITLFRDVKIAMNLQYGKLPFTKASIIQTSTGSVYNYENKLVQQGSTWVFKFNLAGTYAQNSTIRFVFPEGFTSNKIQCNITGIVDSTMQTRVFPQQNIYDCLNVKASLSGTQNIILSGIVNPNFQMQMQGLQVQVVQPNNLVILEKVDIINQPLISAKSMNATVTIPNKFRNNTITYTFEINMDSTLNPGDYMELSFQGNWTFFLQDSQFIEGIESNFYNKARFESVYNWPTNTKLFIRNFSRISKESQTAFYLSLRTPLQDSFYNLTIKAFRANNKVAEFYTRNLQINKTTGYIRQMKLHPMIQPVKLPVGKTGPLQITLALRNNLPKTNVLTFGKVVINIIPHIPVPNVNVNGVVKCYFYGNILAKNCTYDLDLGSTPTKTIVTAFTPVDFNFQSSQIPFMITTQGFVNKTDEGLTIDTLVKRYHFHVQFYTDYSPSIPTEVIFTDWVADPIDITDLACNAMTNVGNQYTHLKCTFTSPNQVLNSGHIHILRLQFTGLGFAAGLGYATENIYPDYPCLVYGANIISNPYPKCDLYTYVNSGPYKGELEKPYIYIYGIETIPPNSSITMEFPKIKLGNDWTYPTGLALTILQDTYGYQTDYIKLYSQTITLPTTQYIGATVYNYISTGVTVGMSNSVINKVSDLTLTNVNLGQSACDYVILQVPTTFPDIGRSQMFTCGSHKCSKFNYVLNYPIQYFILYPQSALALTQTLVFPSIKNPASAGSYTFNLRAYKSYGLAKKISFTVTVTAEPITTAMYTWAPYETVSTMYPKTNRFYKVNFTLVNTLPQQTSYIQIIFNNYFTLASTYCDLTTTVLPWDGRGIQCQVWATNNKVLITNMKQAIGGDTFGLIVQMTTTTSTTLTPTVTIRTYTGSGAVVDQWVNGPFTPSSITNTNLQTLTSFDLSQGNIYNKQITKGYFGDLILNYDPQIGSMSSIHTLVITMTNQFYPYSNALNLPLSCIINSIRRICSYSLNPFTITITGLTTNILSTGNNVINITTQYLQRNGIYFPANQGRYLIKLQSKYSNNNVVQNAQHYIDIKPGRIQSFVVNYVHRDINRDNIFIAEFQNGPTAITAYNDATNASRIYIGFPTTNAAGNVFSSNLGYANGTVIPCYFETGLGYVAPLAGKSLECRLRRSPVSGIPTYVEIINFAAIASGQKIKVWMGKILNPASQVIDVNFNLKINYFNPTTYQQTPQYQNEYNMWFDMLTASTYTGTVADTTSQMFQAGAKVGDANKYIHSQPYSMNGNTFQQNDWYIIIMNSQFALNGVVGNCINNFYKRCIVYKQINWVAININNGTLIPFYPQITQLPLSISRVDTYYTCYVWIAERWKETLTYTISTTRWLELRGSITGFNFQVVGSQNKLNIGQKNVDVLVTFTVPHKVPAKGSIQIQFPSNASRVPDIKPHCRSAVTLGSQLKGMKTPQPATNSQGQIGCLVQNTYSWIITSYQQLPANSQVMITGKIDLPTVLTSTLGTGYIATYETYHSTNVFANGRTIDYLSTNFPLQVQNKTWNLAEEVTLLKSQPLRINHVGRFEFKLQMQDSIRAINSANVGYLDINFWKKTILGDTGGFSAAASPVCIVTLQTTGEKLACKVDSVDNTNSNFVNYRLKFYYALAANTPYMVTLTTQKGDSNEGIPFPTTVGTYKIQTQIQYYTNWVSTAPIPASKAHFVQVYGPKFSVLNLVSTISIPGQNNLLLFQIIPSQTITNNYNRLVIQIATISNDNVNLFDEDLGMGYRNYDDLVFDMYTSTVTSMKCKFYIGDRVNRQPVRIICNQFNIGNVGTTQTIRFAFWVKNPNIATSLAIPIQVYVDQMNNYRKLMWQMLQAGIKILPTTNTPINDYGNFVANPSRQLIDTDFYFTNRNTKPLLTGDYYIMKFNFDLRKSGKVTNAFQYPYNASYANLGDAIFLRNSKTILLQVGGTAMNNWIAADAAQTNKLNVKLAAVIYNPATKLTTTQSEITAYAVYLATQQCQKIIHKDAFPDLVPNQPVTPDFQITAINGNLRKGQYQDYQYKFRVGSGTNLLTDTSLVKRISIQFPASSIYDYKFKGQSCMQDPSSDIQVKKCWIDTTTATIWITPVQKASYLNNHYIVIRTLNKAIINPLTKFTSSNLVYLNKFVIKYYTWADDNNPPAIFATSDDYVFMKQDDTRISGSTYLTYDAGSSTLPHHDYAQFSQQTYVNEFLPLSTDIGTATTRAKTPFVFKFIAMTSFANKQGITGQKHKIKLSYFDFYSSTTFTNSLDLYRYIPICELNAKRILDCVHDTTNKYIQMNFQQPIAAGQQVSVRFSVLDPKDNTDDGFILSNLNNPIITVPIWVTPYGGTTYYMQPQPFSTFYRSSGISYPSMGIVSASVIPGHRVFGKINFLDFSLSFSRSDINGLVLQIPLLQLDGSLIYKNSKLLNLQSGAEYPCSVGQKLRVFCHYQRGQTLGYGKPTRIYISRFQIQAGNTLSLRMLFQNPDVVGSFPSFIFKAYGGPVADQKLMGEQFMGEFKIINPYKVLSQAPAYYDSRTGCTYYSSQRVYMRDTFFDFYIGDSINANNYVMLQWTLHNSGYKQVSQYAINNYDVDYDYFVINYAQNNRKLYIIKKLASNWSGHGSSYFRFGHFRNRHHMHNDPKIYYMARPSFVQYTCTIDQTWHNSNRVNNQFAIAIQYLDIQDKRAGAWSWQFLSIDMGADLSTMALNTTDLGDIIVGVKYTLNKPYSALSPTATDCILQDGMTNINNLLKPITCTIDAANQQFIFKNVGAFNSRYIKFYYYAQTINAQVSNSKVNIRAFANNDAYVADRYALFRDETNTGYTMNQMRLPSNTGYYTNDSTTAELQYGTTEYIMPTASSDSGYININEYNIASNGQIQFSVVRGAEFAFSRNVYKMAFRFYVPRLSFSGTCTVLTQPYAKGGRSCSLSGNLIQLNYTYFSTSNSHSWPTWTAGQQYTFRFRCTITGQANANFLFASFAFNYYTAIHYNANSNQCGQCPCNQCPQAATLTGGTSRDCHADCCGNGNYWRYICPPGGCTYCGWDCWGDYCGWDYRSNVNCRYFICTRYYGWGGQYISGKASNSAYKPNVGFISSVTGDLLSYRRNYQNQLQLQFNTFSKAIGKTQNNYLLIQFNMGYLAGNPFPYTKSTQFAAQVDCKCLISGSTSFTQISSTTYLTPQCVRYYPSTFVSGMNPSVAVNIQVAVGQSLKCYFPGYVNTNDYVHNIDVFIEQNNYLHTSIPRQYWSKWAHFDVINVGMNDDSLPYTLTFDDFYNNLGQNDYWVSGQTAATRLYDLNLTHVGTNYPEIYMSMYAPKPNSILCASYSFSFCRFYDSFINRRFFMVFKSSYASQTNIRIKGNVQFPPSEDQSSSFYPTIAYWNDGGSRYYSGYSNNRNTAGTNLYANLNPATSALDIKSMFGSFLQGYNASMTVSVYMSGKTIYSNSRDYGHYRGSYVKVTFSSLSSLTGCSATIRNRPINLDLPLYCQVKSVSQINIFARFDLTITDYLYFTVYSAQLPSSCTYTVTLFDKYVDGTDYARSYYNTGSFSKPKGSLTPYDRSYIDWRRQAYKQYLTTTGPIRFTLKNTYIYLSDYDQALFAQVGTTDAIVVYLTSGISGSDSYVCYAKQYLPGKQHLYKTFYVPCGYWITNKIYIKPSPAYPINAQTYYYQFTVYRHTSGTSMLINLPSATDVVSRQIISSSTTSSETAIFYDYFDYYRYKVVYPCTLNSIYYLTKQAAALNSLYIDFTVKVGGNTFNIFEFEIPNLGLSSFKISNGQQIPCYLSPQFGAISAKVQAPRCYGYTSGIQVDNPLIIRVFGMTTWVVNTNFKLAFDNFNNPSVQKLFLTPIDITFRYIDATAKTSYQSYWPSVFLSDSINMGSPAQVPGTLSANNGNRGASTYHQTYIGWPYYSNATVSEKIVLKLYGGITCCNSFDNMNLRDNGNSYNLLWRDMKANMSVYITPSYTSGTPRYLRITGVNNPYPYQRDTYEKLKKIQILWYLNYQTVNSKKLDQFNFNDYSRVDEFTVDDTPALIDSTASFKFHQQYPVTHRLVFSTTSNTYPNRQLSYTIVTFSSSVTGIEWAHAGTNVSPYYFNDLVQVTIGKNNANNYFLNISGMSDSSYSASYKWYVQFRCLTSTDTISYTSQTYCLNGQLQFTNSHSWTISSTYYSTTPYAPTYFNLRQQKYFKNYFQLQRIPIYAKASSASQKIQFRFTTPYNIINQETITLSFPDTTELVPLNTPNDIYCVIRKTILANLQTGISYWSECTYTAGKFIVTNPVGNLVANTEYTLTIIQRNQTRTSFKLPYTPKRVQVSHIYTSQLNLMYGDVYELDYQGRMTAFSIAHASWDVNQLNMIGVTFNPGFTLNAASLTSPITQTMLELQIYSKQYDQCGDVRAIYTTDGAQFESGVYFSHFASPAHANSNTRLKCGQYSQSFAPIKLTTTDINQMNPGTSYYFRYPLIRNPSANYYIPFIYKFRLLEYKNGAYYPNVISSYQYEGLQFTRNGNVNGQTGQINNDGNNYVQTTMALTFRWPSFNQGAGSQTWVKFENDVIQSLTDITSLKTITTSDYTYQYYPNINLCVYLKTTNNDVRSVNIGSFPTTDDQRLYRVSWAQLIYSDKLNRQSEGALQYTINKRSAWDTSSFTVVSALQTTYSEGIFRVTFKSNSLRFVQGSYMKLTFSSSIFTIMDEYCKAMSGFTRGSLSTSNLVCKRNSATQIIIQGYSTIAAGTTLSIDLYLKTSTGSVYTQYNNDVLIQVLSQDDKYIISAYTSNMAGYSIGQGSTNLDLQTYMRYPYMKDTARQLYVKFQLASYSLGSNQYVEIDFGDWQLDNATLGTIICKYQTGTNYYWTPASFSLVSGNKYRFTTFTNASNYAIPVGTPITLRLDQINPDNFYGVLITKTKWNYLRITAHMANSTILEHQYAQVWVEPYEHISLNVQPALDYVDAISVYQFTVTPNVSATAGDYILIDFKTADGLYANLFPTNLGKSIATNDSFEISCRENNNVNIISNTGIKCQLFAGSTSPIIPTTIQIKVQKNIAANQLISFNILSLKNPNRASYPIGVTFKLANICYSSDQNKLCTYYKSTKYLYFQNSPGVPTLNTNFGSMSFNPNYVSATPSQHTISAGVGLAIGDFVKIVYYNQVPIPTTCSLTPANGICYAYPLQNTILIKATVAQASSYTFTLTGMTNLYQYSGSNLYTQVWSVSGTRQIARMFNTLYTVPIITTDPVSTNPLSITFTPTLTSNYQLSYGFDNIAKVQIKYLFQNKNIQQIRITSPSYISLNLYYCNATLESTAAEAKPYPYRFKCQILSTSVIRITLQSDFPAWTAAFINKNINLYIKYQISTNIIGTNCSDWIAEAFTHPSSTSSMYKVSEARGKFFVQLYMSPFIYKVDFFTLSFTSRICLTGQQCMFYGYLLPSNPTAVPQNPQIKYFDYTLPPQFQYSSLLAYDKCDMKQNNADAYSFGCSVSRNNSKITVRFMPTTGGYLYNHNYKLLKIDHSDPFKLFTAPQYPGNHYQMKVQLYTNTDTLIQSQFVNLTTVFGSLLNYSDIQITIPKDANTVGAFQFTFKVGSNAIQPGYESSATNRITSAIEVIFSKSFLFDLGTGKKSGQQIACLPVLNLNLKTMGKLTCRIYPSYSTITYPTIIVTGYDKILSGQVVTFRIAGLTSLPAATDDYIKIGVSYKYYDYGNVKGYLYDPTGKVVGGTTAPNTFKNMTINIVQVSSNFVGQLVNYTFSCTSGTSFSNVQTTDYIAVQFPLHGFQGRFSMNQKVKCTLATGQACQSYGLANVIYFKLSAIVASTTLTFSLQNMINTAFGYDYKTMAIKVYTIVSGKIDSYGQGNIVKFSKPSLNISGLITKSDSIYGGQSGLNYYMDFKLGTYLPEYGKISITFPSVYASLFALNAKCNFTEQTYKKLGQGASCDIVDKYQVIISPNGILMDGSYTYGIIISNLTNPNLNISKIPFIIQSYYDYDIYNRSIISKNVFYPPEINVLSVKTCQFDLTVQTKNQNYKSFYLISLICPSVIKQASRLQIYLPWNLTESGKQICSTDTSSLYSYECSIKNEYINNRLVSFMEIYLRQHVPQKLISIKGEITNGQKGSYTLNASISSKSFTYLIGTSNKIYIEDTTVKSLANLEIQVQNYPYNRNYESLYTFKITNPKVNANSLRIQIPAVIKQGQNGVTCNSQLSNTNKDYFMFLTLLNATSLNCSMTGQSLLINGLSNVILALKDDQFLFLDVFGLKNPDVSVDSSSFKFTFLNITDSTGSAIGNIVQTLAYKVSQAPYNLQINDVSLTSNKYQIMTKYTFTASTIAGSTVSINSNSQIGIKVQFPIQYSKIWSITPQPIQIKVYLGSSVYTSTNINMITRKLMAKFTSTAYESFSQIKVQFDFRNPSTSINCTASNFIISVFDFKLNSIVAQTVGNNIACLNFSDRLYWIKISGNSQIQSGNLSDYTIQIQKPAKYLKIKPTSTSSAISFSPAEIIFQNYSSTIQRFKIISSPAFTGSYLITFVKTQNGADLFYNDIKNQTITIIAPIVPYLINFEQINVKSIGAPIETFISIQVPSSTTFALLHTNNCTSAYQIVPQGRITVPAGASKVSFSVKYTGSIIPYMCSIKFEISSLTNINYALSQNVLYVSGEPSIDRTNSLRPMLLRITKNPKDSKDVGSSILTSDPKSALKPSIYQLKDKLIKANSAQLQINLSEQGFVYYAAMQIGTETDKVTQKMIYDKNVKTGVVYNNTRAYISSIGSVNIVTDLFLDGLLSDKRYLVGAYLNSTVGISDIKFKEVQTSKSSNGAVIKICFNSIQTNDTVMATLSTILRLKLDRLSVFTLSSVLIQVNNSYQTQVMNSRRYIYQVVLAPNRNDDSISPLQSFTELIQKKDLQNKVKSMVPSFDLTYSMTTHELIMAKPRARGNGIVVDILTDRTVRVRVMFWQAAYVYGVIIPKENSKPSLLSKQIKQGLSRSNQILNATHRVSTQTDSQGVATLQFRLLQQLKQYSIYVTAECILPYNPRAIMSDNEVLSQTIKTRTNLNVANNGEKVLNQLKNLGDQNLAKAVKQHLNSVQQKKLINVKPNKIRKRN